ncbi:uncharacterized protein LOC108913104 isoform X2 [Anoplophora glabripennis]|uniref:uncharacterized protein LOC108913104 isoform X2 n=1 Tax=Anoplophora glabripennis TaxID=217634 RepID=UPI00087497C3|nr:uncharacterized protein LOC108913104 isoform X2 [Anoplophora glabripennis]XP_018574098.1 uncharacterized protein LOC108913104 isoform X2 [Anoplophora glabripennis]
MKPLKGRTWSIPVQFHMKHHLDIRGHCFVETENGAKSLCATQIIDNAKPLIAGSKPNNVLEYPWVVALYIKENNSYEYICGGSILSLTVALTAAHCVTNDYGDTLNKEDFLIGAGKLYSKHNASQDTRAQYLMLSKIIVHEDFKGASRLFLADIAVLVTKGEFVLNSLVQPVCFNNMKTIYLHPGSIGKVSGWGRTEDEDTSEILRTLNIPYKDGATCAEELPKEFTTTFNIVDKICAGFSNKSTSVCDGDSGNGLTFVNLEDNRYYIHGVVSLGPQRNGQCDIQHNTLYTKVAFYYEYIDRLLTTYAPTIKDCVLPAHPQNGKWTTQQQGLKPGDAVSLSTVLNIECNKGFKLTSLSTNINCGSTHNMPVCQPLCPALNFRNGSNYWCTNKAGQAIDCLEAVEGSTLGYSCPKAYKIADGTGRTNNRTCSMGSWGLPQPECLQSIRNCGRKGNVSNTLNAEDTAEGLLEFPWNINIYKITNKSGLTKYMYNCGGSLISHKVIVAGASCLSSYKGQVNSEEDYLIGAGKIYPNYNDSRDVHAQYSEVSNIILHKNYKGDTRRYFANIAIIVIKKPFTLNNFVQPICFTDVDNIRLHPGDIGVTLKYKAEDKQELLKIPYREDAICRQELPSEFAEKYYEEDKFCAGTKYQTNLCQGDTGKGFVVKNPEDHRYYIYGIASASYSEEPKKCHHIVLFTNVSIYYDFIDDILSQYE